MTEIGYTVEADFIENTELTMKPGIMVLSGLNATMKSIAARTFLVAGKEDHDSISKYSPNFITLLEQGGRIDFKDSHAEIVSNARKLLVSDSRLVSRAILRASNNIRYLQGRVDDLRRREKSLESDIIEIERYLEEILKDLGLSFLEEVFTERGRASQSIVHEIYEELNEVIRIVVEELKDVFKDFESAKKAIMPLSIGVRDPRGLKVDVFDNRFKKNIPTSTVSTSIIAPLLFDLVTVFLSQPAGEIGESYCIGVIEEPEESMTPLQQAVFSMYLERAVERSRELTGCTPYIIIVTHSPYIAYAFSEKVPIKYFGFDVSKRKIVIEDKPLKAFAMADVLITSRVLRASGTGMEA